MATQLTILELLRLIMALGGSQQSLVQCHSGIMQLHHKLSKRMHVFDVEEKKFSGAWRKKPKISRPLARECNRIARP